MSEFKQVIDTIGFWNLFSILTFIIGTIYTVYTFFKSFYRIVYSYQRTCKTCESSKDWRDADQNFASRIIFYNNGRKTLTKSEIKQIKIFSSKINSIKTKSDSNVNAKVSDDKKCLKLEFDYLDASKYFVVELNHNGKIKIQGRVLETGEFLHTETKGWLIANFALVTYCFASIFYLIFTNTEEIVMMKRMGINLIIIMLFYLLFRYLHKLFFIPDSITTKYLETTNKRDTEFFTKL